MLLIGATGWFGTSRLVRGEVLRLREEAYVRAAEALGARRRRIIFRHLLPNTAGPLLVAATLGVGDVILLEAGLSFLGLGVQPPTPSWGGMILDAKAVLVSRAVGRHLPRPRHRHHRAGRQPGRRRPARRRRSPRRMTRVLEVENLRVSFPAGDGGRVYPVDGVSFTLDRGETLALVGESGCGKSLTSLALLRLVPSPGRIEPGSTIRLGDTDVLALEGEALRRIRGRRIGMIFQDPMTSLNPVFTVGDQIAEGVRAHFRRLPRPRRAIARCTLLQEVGIPDPAARLDAYPHQLSGGMRQRVMIAIALSAEPEILVADEPTTALDVTVQAQILEVLDRLRERRGMAVLLITHDLGIVAGRADRVAVMYAGQIVEEAPTAAPVRQSLAPLHPGAVRLGSAHHAGRRAAHPDRRHRAAADRLARRLPVPSPLPQGVRQERARCRRCCRWARTIGCAAGSPSGER